MGVLSILLCLVGASVAQAGEPRIFVLADGSVFEAEVLAELDASWLIELPDGTKRRLGIDQVVEVIGDDGVMTVGGATTPDDSQEVASAQDELLEERVWVDVVPDGAAADLETTVAPAQDAAPEELSAVPLEASAPEELPMEPMDEPVSDEPEVIAAATPVDTPASDGVELVEVQPAQPVATPQPLAIPAGKVGAVLGTEPADEAPPSQGLADEERAVSVAPTTGGVTDGVPEEPAPAKEVEPSSKQVETPTQEASVVAPAAQGPAPLSEALSAGSSTTMTTSRRRFGIGTGISGGTWAQPGGGSGSYDLFPLELRFYSPQKEGRSLDVVLNWFHGTGGGSPGSTWTAGLAVYSHRRRAKSSKLSLAFAPGAELAFGGIRTGFGVEPIMGLWSHVRMGVDLQPFGERTEWGIYARPSAGFMADLSGNSGFAGLMAGIVLELTGTWIAR